MNIRDFEKGTAKFVVAFDGLPKATPAKIREAVGKWKTGAIGARVTAAVAEKEGALRAGDFALANPPKGETFTDHLADIRKRIADGASELVLGGALTEDDKGGAILVLSDVAAPPGKEGDR